MPIIRSPFTKLMGNEVFSSVLAEEHGLIEALVISNIARHIGARRPEFSKELNGKTFIRSSISDMHMDMPYLTPHQLRRAVARLLKKEVLMRAQIGGMDRSSWLAIASL